MNFNDVEQSTTHRTMVFGDPGSGKSAAIAELAKNYNILYIDLEGGGKVLSNPSLGLTREHKNHINYVQIPDTKDNPIGAVTLEKLTRFKNGTICVAHGIWDCTTCAPQPAKPAKPAFIFQGKETKPATPATEATNGEAHTKIDFDSMDDSWVIVIDSMTQLSGSILAACMHKAGRGGIEDKAEFDDWGSLGKNLDLIGSRIQNSSRNIVVITHVAVIEQEDGKDKLTGVAGTAKYARNFPRFFDHKVYCSVKNGKHVQQSSSTTSNLLLTSSRTGADTETGNGLLAIYKEYRGYKKI